MKRIDIHEYYHLGSVVKLLIELTGAHTPPADAVSKSMAKEIRGATADAIKIAERVELDSTSNILRHAKETLSKEVTYQEIRTLFECIETTARNDLRKVFAGYVPAERSRFWGQEKPFGDQVHQRFESARADATAAGNCYAVEQYTACVFHCMRVAEKGMRTLARERKITVIKSKPLEWNDWGKIIQAIEGKANELAQKLKMGPVRDRALEFYRDAAGELYGFKDAYRNYVTHDRATYDYHEAAAVYHRVGGFMQRLSRHLDESNPTAIKWKK